MEQEIEQLEDPAIAVSDTDSYTNTDGDGVRYSANELALFDACNEMLRNMDPEMVKQISEVAALYGLKPEQFLAADFYTEILSQNYKSDVDNELKANFKGGFLNWSMKMAKGLRFSLPFKVALGGSLAAHQIISGINANLPVTVQNGVYDAVVAVVPAVILGVASTAVIKKIENY